MVIRGSTIDEVIATGATYSSTWNIERGETPWNMPALVGNCKSDAVVTVKVQQSNDGSTVVFEETVSNIPGNATLAAGTTGAFRFARVAPYVRFSISNASGGDATASMFLYGSN